MPDQDTVAAMEKSEACRLKDEIFYSSLFQRFFEKAYGYALFYCGSEQMAEDVVQDVFLKIWDNMNELRLKNMDWHSWHSYLFVLVRNHASNVKRSSRKQAALKAGYKLLADTVVYDHTVLEKEFDKLFDKAVKTLAYQQKEIFVLSYYRFRPKTIAKEMNRSIKTIRNTLAKARKKVSEEINGWYEINEEMVKLANEAGASL
jgi:RNA polymerase sigma-70 factor (ECF subfamily)